MEPEVPSLESLEVPSVESLEVPSVESLEVPSLEVPLPEDPLPLEDPSVLEDPLLLEDPPVLEDPLPYENWSALPVADVPTMVVTTTSTVPLPVGAVAVIWVSLSTFIWVADVFPKPTELAKVNPEPVITTLVPAAPLAGEIPVTVGEMTSACAALRSPLADR